MINIFMPWSTRRDERKLSPHSHENFEQMSLGLKGSFVHHLRYPWASDKTRWRDDEHEYYDSPSVLVIPARVIHTTQDIVLDMAGRHFRTTKGGLFIEAGLRAQCFGIPNANRA